MAKTVKKLSPRESKTALAQRLNISRSSLYYDIKLPAKDLILKAQIEQVMEDNKAYGHKRIAMELGINKKRVLRVMKLFNLKVQRKRKKPRKPKDLGQAATGIPNLIKGTIVASPNQIWVSDFTYLPYFAKTIYLATIEDIYTRQVVGWAVSNRRNTNLVSLALISAIVKNPIPKIIHSDQGSEYKSKEYLNVLKSLDIKISMSAKASPWENGYQESFFAGFKLELGHPEIYEDLGELIEAISQQIYYYNTRRIHTALKMPPAVFAERQLNTPILLKSPGYPF